MEKKTGSTGSGCRGGQFQPQSDHQSAAVTGGENNFSDVKRKLCSSLECRDADRNVSKAVKDTRRERTTANDTSEKYLQDSYRQAFQKHVDNLANVISQHRSKDTQGEEEKIKAEVRRRELENSRVRNSRSAKVAGLAPLTRLEIKSDAGINQIITFGQDDDEEESERKMNVAKHVNVVTGKLQEENFLESLVEPNPMITFNHVCTEEETNKIAFHQILSNSRSPSPMLEENGDMNANAETDALPNQLDNERKLFREKLYSGIFEKHRQTIFVIGAFFKLFRTTSSMRKKNYKVK